MTPNEKLLEGSKEANLTAIEALNYIEDIQYGRSLDYDVCRLKLRAEQDLQILDYIRKNGEISIYFNPLNGYTEFRITGRITGMSGKKFSDLLRGEENEK